MLSKPFAIRRAAPLILILAAAVWIAVSADPAAKPAASVLIVMDEKEQMEVLANYMEKHGNVKSLIVDQKNMPDDWSGYDAAIGFVHGKLEPAAEKAIINYTEKGGRYICIHHSISSGKAKNEFYFDFLGIRLDGTTEAKNPSTPGGHYAWKDPVTLTLVNLNPNHYVTNHNIDWDETVAYASSDQPSVERDYPAFTLEDAEAYVNHKFTDGREKTVLAGFKWLDERNKQLYMQDRAVWYKQKEKGMIFYFKPGHSSKDFENPRFSQMVLNSILWKP